MLIRSVLNKIYQAQCKFLVTQRIHKDLEFRQWLVPHHAANTVYLNSVFTASNISVIQIMSTTAAVALLRGEGCNNGFQFVCTDLAE